MSVESVVTVMLMAKATGLVVGMSQSCSPILSVWARNVSGLEANVRRQKMPQHVGGDTKGHQGGEMGAQPIRIQASIDNAMAKPTQRSMS